MDLKGGEKDGLNISNLGLAYDPHAASISIIIY